MQMIDRSAIFGRALKRLAISKGGMSRSNIARPMVISTDCRRWPPSWWQTRWCSVSGELFKMMTGVNMLHVPYRGAPPALTDLIGGQVHVMFDNMPSSIEHIRAGRLRPLAVTATTRWQGLPDVPTLGDFVPGFETSAWAGIGAPKNTPGEIIDTLNREVNAALAEPTIKARFVQFGGEVLPLSPSEYGKCIVEETEKWAKVIKFSGARPD